CILQSQEPSRTELKFGHSLGKTPRQPRSIPVKTRRVGFTILRLQGESCLDGCSELSERAPPFGLAELFPWRRDADYPETASREQSRCALLLSPFLADEAITTVDQLWLAN